VRDGPMDDEVGDLLLFDVPGRQRPLVGAHFPLDWGASTRY
jgi:hypothetical protein